MPKNPMPCLVSSAGKKLTRSLNKLRHSTIIPIYQQSIPVNATEVLLNANEIRYGNTAKKCGTIFCGFDPVELDSYGFVLLKNGGEKKLSYKSVTDIPYIVESEKRGLGSTNYVLEKI